MNSKKLFWGVFLLLIGLLLILRQLHFIHFSWWNLWPVLLIIIGISMLPIKEWFKSLGMIVVIAGALALNYIAGDRKGQQQHDFDFMEENEAPESTQSYNIPFDSTCLYAKLNVDLGAGKFKIDDTTPQLIDLNQTGRKSIYTLNSESTDSLTTVEVKINDHQHHWRSIKNSVNIKLNTQPIWDMDLDIGAATADFDLSHYKLRKLGMNCGASSVDIKLGALLAESFVDIETGASSLTLRIPTELGCQIVYEGALTEKNFAEFSKTTAGNYETANFASAAKKMVIHLESGVASVDIIRY